MATVPSLDAEDRIIGPFTGRQLALASVGAVVAIGAYWALQGIGVLVAMPIAAVMAGAGAGMALLPPLDGLRHERIPLMAAADALAPRRQVWGGDILPLPRHVTGWRIRERIGELRWPWRDVTEQGDLNLGRAGLARIYSVTSLDFGLLTPEEQQARVESFARLLNTLDHPIQIVVRAETAPGHAVPAVASGGFPLFPPASSALSALAADHAELLRSYSTQPRRRTYVVARASSRPALDAHADEIASALAGMGLRARRLDRDRVEALIGRAVGG